MICHRCGAKSVQTVPRSILSSSGEVAVFVSVRSPLCRSCLKAVVAAGLEDRFPSPRQFNYRRKAFVDEL